MKHPSVEQVQKVIDTFKAALPLATAANHLDFRQNRVCDLTYKAGTSHCVGGWYAVGALKLQRKRMGIENYCQLLLKRGFKEGRYGITWEDGLDLIERDLGEEPRLWASYYPKIWGNGYWMWMFGGGQSSHAYSNAEKKRLGAKTLQDVITHWEEVRDRLIELNKNAAITNPPLTPEKLIAYLERGVPTSC